MLRGVDVSKYNGRCDYQKAKKSGVNFVIIKADSGATGEDPMWVSHYLGAKEVGLGVGTYWYCYARDVNSAKREAYMFLNSLKGMKFDYPVYLDLEDEKYQGNLGNKLRTDIAVEFLSILESHGYYVGMYSMKYWFDQKFDMNRLKKYDLWIARWYSQSHGYTGVGEIGMWQYTNRGRFRGMGNTGEGGVDCNVSYVDYPKLIVGKNFNGY
ncbi:glycoside hydrolase family 25 protein [Peptostreptococcus faecalis]|uniref:glycoside hydrolase family 25 protein n=1 Tax=Peptostreptococcus faecalis TaxID=2045015 RepID=UPI000C7963ED|nr:glycoside hydrolase family 25 protein [Peptostreptococcus faecalis]